MEVGVVGEGGVGGLVWWEWQVWCGVGGLW